ncbi:UNVERIFIED_ORG: hypothetical protein BDK47_11839 [Anoxybacillus amylolyticus]
MVIVCLSVVAGNGAKHVAFQIAAMRQKLKREKKVLVIDFDLESPFLAASFFDEGESRGVSRLLEQMRSAHFSEDLFLSQVIHTTAGVDVLRGGFVRAMLTKEYAEHILVLAKRFYDDVLVVVRPSNHQAASIVSLMQADGVLLVVRNNQANLLRLSWVMDYVEMYADTKRKWAVYNYKNRLSHVSISERLVERGYQVAGVLEFCPSEVDHRHFQRRWSFFSNASVYKRMVQLMFSETSRSLGARWVLKKKKREGK